MITVKYIQEGSAILATVVDDKGVDQWPGGHYLSADEQALLQSDPTTLAAKLALAIPTPVVATPPVPPPAPVQLSTVTLDPTTAQATVDAYTANQQAIQDGLAALTAQANDPTIPIATRITAVQQAAAVPAMASIAASTTIAATPSPIATKVPAS